MFYWDSSFVTLSTWSLCAMTVILSPAISSTSSVGMMNLSSRSIAIIKHFLGKSISLMVFPESFESFGSGSLNMWAVSPTFMKSTIVGYFIAR